MNIIHVNDKELFLGRRRSVHTQYDPYNITRKRARQMKQIRHKSQVTSQHNYVQYSLFTASKFLSALNQKISWLKSIGGDRSHRYNTDDMNLIFELIIK